MHGDDPGEIRNRKREVIFNSSFNRKEFKATVQRALEADTDLTDADLSTEYRRMSNGVVSYAGQRRILRGVLFDRARLQGANLSATDFRGSSFVGADLRSARLDFADMSDTNLSGARLGDVHADNTNFKGANLQGAILTGARLGWATFEDADLTGADLSGADLRAANFTNAILDDTLTGGARKNGLTIWKGASLHGSTLTRSRAVWSKVLSNGSVLLLFAALAYIASRF